MNQLKWYVILVWNDLFSNNNKDQNFSVSNINHDQNSWFIQLNNFPCIWVQKHHLRNTFNTITFEMIWSQKMRMLATTNKKIEMNSQD